MLLTLVIKLLIVHGQYAGAVFLDLAKAFDCVDHAILLKKSTGYGICGDVHSWLRSFYVIEHSKLFLKEICHPMDP